MFILKTTRKNWNLRRRNGGFLLIMIIQIWYLMMIRNL